MTQSYTWSVNERLDIRWIARSDRVLRMWINGVQGGTDNNLLDDCVADSPNVVVVGRNSSETDASSGIIVERLRYKSGAVTDGEILGWT